MDYTCDTHLNSRVEDYLWDEFPCDKPVTDESQRRFAKMISDEGESADVKQAMANQVVEFLVTRRGIRVRNVVQELKDLYSHSFGRRLCKWEAQQRREALRRHPSSSQLVSISA